MAATLVIDLDWWIRQSYNLALRRSKAWSSLVAIRLMQSCFAVRKFKVSGEIRRRGGANQDMQFIHIRESKFRPSQSETDRLLGIRLNGSFLCCLHLVVLARSEDHIESQLQFYLNLRSHASSYRRHVQDHWNEPVRSAATLGEHIKKRYTTLLLLDLEAAIYLKAWHSLRTIIDELVLSSSTQTPNAFAAVADLILASRAPAAELLSTLQYMVQTLSSLDHPRPLSKTQLARWIRCLVHTALQCDPEAAERVLAQIPEIAADNCLPSPSQILRHKREGADIVAHQADSLIYPQEELEWLVAAVWNRAIDLFCTNDKVAFNRWADLAVGIATTMNDQGRMADHLRTNRAGLAFSEEEGIIP